jgi:hypothetical protein
VPSTQTSCCKLYHAAATAIKNCKPAAAYQCAICIQLLQAIRLAHLAECLEEVSVSLQVLLVGDQQQLLLNAAGEDFLAVLVVELDGGGQLLALDQVAQAVLADLALQRDGVALLVCTYKRTAAEAACVSDCGCDSSFSLLMRSPKKSLLNLPFQATAARSLATASSNTPHHADNVPFMLLLTDPA